jgi:hypothetical protein
VGEEWGNQHVRKTRASSLKTRTRYGDTSRNQGPSIKANAAHVVLNQQLQENIQSPNNKRKNGSVDRTKPQTIDVKTGKKVGELKRRLWHYWIGLDALFQKTLNTPKKRTIQAGVAFEDAAFKLWFEIFITFLPRL